LDHHKLTKKSTTASPQQTEAILKNKGSFVISEGSDKETPRQTADLVANNNGTSSNHISSSDKNNKSFELPHTHRVDSGYMMTTANRSSHQVMSIDGITIVTAESNFSSLSNLKNKQGHSNTDKDSDSSDGSSLLSPKRANLNASSNCASTDTLDADDRHRSTSFEKSSTAATTHEFNVIVNKNGQSGAADASSDNISNNYSEDGLLQKLNFEGIEFEEIVAEYGIGGERAGDGEERKDSSNVNIEEFGYQCDVGDDSNGFLDGRLYEMSDSIVDSSSNCQLQNDSADGVGRKGESLGKKGSFSKKKKKESWFANVFSKIIPSNSSSGTVSTASGSSDGNLKFGNSTQNQLRRSNNKLNDDDNGGNSIWNARKFDSLNSENVGNKFMTGIHHSGVESISSKHLSVSSKKISRNRMADPKKSFDPEIDYDKLRGFYFSLLQTDRLLSKKQIDYWNNSDFLFERDDEVSFRCLLTKSSRFKLSNFNK